MASPGWRGAWSEISPRAQDEFLQHIANGDSRVVAARKVGHTATEFKFLTKRDDAFRAEFVEAQEGKQDEIRARWDEKALDDNRMLLEQANTYLPERAYIRKQTVEHSGPEGKPIQHEQRLTLADVARFASERGLGNGAGGELPASAPVLPAPEPD